MYKRENCEAVEKMDDDVRSKKDSKSLKQNNFDGIVVTAINLAAMSASVAAAISARKARRSTLETAVSELNAKVEELAEQLRKIYGNPSVQQEPQAGTPNRKEGAVEQKDDNSQQKPQDVIYVRKASEFWFYN